MGQKNRLLHEKAVDDTGLKQIEHYYQQFQSHGIDDPLLWYRYIDLKVHQSDYFLCKLDRISMYYGIEARTPFLDELLVKSSMQMDATLFLHKGINKKLLKKVALDYLPASIVHRKKRGFSYPFLEWLEALGGFKTMRQLNDKHKIFHEKALKDHLHLASKGGSKQHTFGIYLLLIWVERQSI
jgi:asparagine synthase (glutamine-hydrolysing)